LFGAVHPADKPLTSQIVAALLELTPGEAEAVIYAPLGVGHHVDHQIVYAAAWQLRQQGRKIAFYEDYPYSDANTRYATMGQGHTLEMTLAAQRAANLQPHVRFFAEENLQAKIDSVRAYYSQLGMLFGGEAEMEQRLRHYALWVGDGKLAERLWIPGNVQY
jgi:LmbE family N-acetylglucosaminyl deacetylase